MFITRYFLFKMSDIGILYIPDECSKYGYSDMEEIDELLKRNGWFGYFIIEQKTYQPEYI